MQDSETTHDRGVLPLLLSMISTRVELAAIDVEAHLQATLVAMLTTFIAVVLALVAFIFIGVVVIVVFWDTYRLAAALSVLAAYGALALFIALRARSAWNTRPAAFAATLRELELDRSAFRSGS
jgi:uncharacterized membrane protein YqjE